MFLLKDYPNRNIAEAVAPVPDSGLGRVRRAATRHFTKRMALETP